MDSDRRIQILLIPILSKVSSFFDVDCSYSYDIFEKKKKFQLNY